MTTTSTRIGRALALALGVLGVVAVASMARAPAPVPAAPSASASAAASAAPISSALIAARNAVVPPNAPHADEDLTALLDGLREGDVIRGWTVAAIIGPVDRLAEIVVTRGELRFTVGLRANGVDVGRNAPLHTRDYALEFGHFQPDGARPDDAEVRRVLDDVFARVRRREASTPPPEGM